MANFDAYFSIFKGHAITKYTRETLEGLDDCRKMCSKAVIFQRDVNMYKLEMNSSGDRLNRDSNLDFPH